MPAEPEVTERSEPIAEKPRRRVHFEKTAGARATRSQNPTLVRGMGTSAGYAMLAMGATLASSVYLLGSTELSSELAAGELSSVRRALLPGPTVL